MKKNNTTGIIIGLLCVLIGVGYLAKVFGMIEDFTIFFSGWWTMFIILPCLFGIISRSNEDKGGYLIGLIVGLVLLLIAQDVIASDKIWALLFAGIFVVIGMNLLFPKKKKSWDQNNFSYSGHSTGTATGEHGERIIVDELGSAKQENFTGGDGEKVVCSAVFAGRDIRVENSVFEGANLSSVFGGIDLNLKNAIIPHNVTIEVSVIFGGIDILVPPDVRVVVDVTPIMGGVDNGTHAPLGADENTPTVYIKGSCVFGGLDVK